MEKNKSNIESIAGEPGRIETLRMKKARLHDLLLILIVLLFGILSIWTGRMRDYNMTPSGAAQTSSMLDDLQLPRLLPNASIQKEDGTLQNLWDVTTDKFTIITVYAPWCGPCQEELPLIAAQLSKNKNYIVLVSKGENPGMVREQLNNLGLANVPFYQDITDDILSQGKVKALPTTFLLTINGRVVDRQIGYSTYGLYRLIRRAAGGPNDFSL